MFAKKQDKQDKQEQDGDYYPAEASDIDEDDDSDMEGEGGCCLLDNIIVFTV